MGSCFADEMGKRLAANKFEASTNPLGIAFNPLSLFQLIRIGMGSHQPEIDLHPRLNHAFSFDLHTLFSSPEESKLRHQLDKLKADFIPLIQDLDYLILTFGTAHIYEKKSDGMLVNNCHKLPQRDFSRRMLNPEEILRDFFETIDTLWELRPELQLILTVSPIRHIRDGLTSSSLSKSILRYSCELIQSQDTRIHYFPSYEILMDELRDYRFYKEDMIHPSEQATNIIWEKFLGAAFSSECISILREWEKIRMELNHKALHPWSKEYFSFMEKLFEKLQKIEKKGLKTANERAFMQKSLDHWREKYSTMQKKQDH